MARTIRKHQKKLDAHTPEGQIRQILIERLPAPDHALRAHALSVAAEKQEDTDTWFLHWFQMLDAIELAAPGEAPAILCAVSDIYLGETGKVFEKLNDAELDKLIDTLTDGTLSEESVGDAADQGIKPLRELLAGVA